MRNRSKASALGLRILRRRQGVAQPRALACLLRPLLALLSSSFPAALAFSGTSNFRSVHRPTSQVPEYANSTTFSTPIPARIKEASSSSISSSSDFLGSLGASSLEPNFFVGLESTQFLSPGAAVPEGAHSYRSKLDLGFESLPRKEFVSGVDAVGQARVSMGFDCQSCSYFEVQQAFGKYSVGTASSGASMIVGRRALDWNLADHHWQLGIIQPRFRSDELHPLESGLSGIFVDLVKGPTSLSLFASGLYIPERGTPVNWNQGTLSSDSPWFVQPPSEVVFLDKATPIRYYPQIPPASQVVRQNSIGVWAHTSAQISPSLLIAFTAFAADKPSNQLPLSYNAILDLSSLTARIDLYPRVVRQRVAGFDMSATRGSAEIWASYFVETPYEMNDSRFQQGSTIQYFSPAHVFAAEGSYRFDFSPAVGCRLAVSGLMVNKKPDQDIGPLAQGSSHSIFADRYQLQRALRSSLQIPFRMGTGERDWQVEAAFTRDLQYASELAQISLAWKSRSGWGANIGIDILGANNQSDGFYGQYRANDRVAAGVMYVF